jgi:hypothetical protein
VDGIDWVLFLGQPGFQEAEFTTAKVSKSEEIYSARQLEKTL